MINILYFVIFSVPKSHMHATAGYIHTYSSKASTGLSTIMYVISLPIKLTTTRDVSFKVVFFALVSLMWVIVATRI